MEPIEVHSHATPDLQEPVLIEGLPGTGLIGTLGANHLVEELEGRLVREIYSEYFHAVVTVDRKSVATLDPLTIHAIETDGRDLLILGGRIQAENNYGQYRLTNTILDIAETFGVNELYTMGGAVMSEAVKEPTVIGAVAEKSDELKISLEDAGVTMREEAPRSIGGVSGLLLGLAPQRDMTAASLLGTTGGFHVNPKCAQAVLAVLEEILRFNVDLTPFVEESEKKKESVRTTQLVLEMAVHDTQDCGESLRYLG